MATTTTTTSTMSLIDPSSIMSSIMSSTLEACTPKICASDAGPDDLPTFLPLFRTSENQWPRPLRAILYLLGLLWMFLGVAIVADIFMAAIEKITSAKKRVFDKKKNKFVTVIVWNATVANLSLMALGSSAPEILLSCIELLLGDFYSGSLGASTIVGSAAFNLFCIIAVCVSAIPAGQVRYIKDTQVFFVTAVSSIFAYIWLLMIVAGPWSKDYIEIWEGVLTFLFFPILVILAFMADKGYFSKSGVEMKNEMKRMALVNAATRDFASMHNNIRRKYGANLNDEQIADCMEAEYAGTDSRAKHRVAAIRGLVGGKRVKLRNHDPASIAAVKPDPDAEGSGMTAMEEGKCVIEFVSEAYSVGEACGTMQVGVRRRGMASAMKGTVKVKYQTSDGSAKSGQDYNSTEGELVFEPAKIRDSSASSKEGSVQEVVQTVSVGIINDRESEADEFFNVELIDVSCDDPKVNTELGKKCQVKIIDDDLPGELAFEEHSLTFDEQVKDWQITLKVKRTKGCLGQISCKWKTEDDTAIQSVDYEAASGELVFENGQEENSITILLKSNGRYDDTDKFRVILEEHSENTKFNSDNDGGEDTDICYVHINAAAAAKNSVDAVMKLMQSKASKAQVGHDNYRAQFIDAIMVNGGGEAEEGEEVEKPSIKDWIMHIITIFWKVLFAFIPPTDYCGGWLTFCIALVFIGMVTAFIGDLASLLGCVWGIPDAITAVTFVALGTSLPDTFASKTAACQDEYADNSIGNVTGSNSVNVFLGIGLPWMIGAIFWSGQGPTKDAARYQEWVSRYHGLSGVSLTTDAATREGNVFVVLSGSLTICVMAFCALAATCMAVLVVRRITPSIGGELGGPNLLKYATSLFLVVLWLIFLIVYIVVTVGNMTDCDYTTPMWQSN